MELRQLEYFVAVVEENGFTRAAERERVAQPGVSAQIRRLEAELGEPLLERSRSGVRLTEAGAAMLPFARAALAGAQGVRVAIDELRGMVRGRVGVGVAPACAPMLAATLARFHADHPGVEISLVENTTAVLLEGIRAGTLDLALAGLAGKDPDGCETETVTDEPVLAAVHPGHALAGRKTVTLARLADEPLIALPPGTGLRAALDEASASAGVHLRIAFEAGDPRTLADLAARGLGVALLPGAHPEGLATLEVVQPRVRSRLALIWHSGGPAGPAARALISAARGG